MKELQLLSLTNFNLTHDNASELIDNYRNEIINLNNYQLIDDFFQLNLFNLQQDTN